MAALRSQEAEQEQNDKEKLAMLEKMAQAQLAGKAQTILHGSSDDEEIHKGTVVDKHQQIYVDASSNPEQVDSAIRDFFDGDLAGGVKKLILAGVDELLGNFSTGENEAEDILICLTILVFNQGKFFRLLMVILGIHSSTYYGRMYS